MREEEVKAQKAKLPLDAKKKRDDLQQMKAQGAKQRLEAKIKTSNRVNSIDRPHLSRTANIDRPIAECN